MKKKICLLLFVMFVSFFAPKNIFAKTLEINYPTNYVSEGELMFLYSVREVRFFLSFLEGDYVVYYNNNSPKNIFGKENSDRKARFYKLPGVEDDDLIFHITDEFRNQLIDNYHFDLSSGYDTIKFNVKEMPMPNFFSNYIIDFTKFDDLLDFRYVDAMLLDSFSQDFDDINLPFNISGSFSDNAILTNFTISSKDNKLLLKILFDEQESKLKIIIPDNVTYKDNITLKLADLVPDYQTYENPIAEQITLIFAHEPSP